MRWSFVLFLLIGCAPAVVIEPPPPTDPGLVDLEAQLGNTHVLAGTSSDMVARIRVTARDAVTSARPPINLGLVIDTSGSMEGDAILDARDASLALVEQMRIGDRLTVVTFNSTAEVIWPSTVLTAENLGDLRSRIGEMQAHGTTDLAAGLAAVHAQMVPHNVANGINRLVLLSDGVPNEEPPVRAWANQFAANQVSIAALGLGNDYNEILLGEIAQLTHGTFHYVAESQAVAAVFRDEVLRLERMIARSAVVEIVPGPGVEISSVMGGQDPMANQRALMVPIGDLAAGEHRDVLVRMRVGEHAAGSAVEILDARLAFQDATIEVGAMLERRSYLGARATNDAAQIETGHNAEIVTQANEMQAAAIAIEVLRQARYGQLDAAQVLMNELPYDLRSTSVMQDLEEMVAPAEPGAAPSAPPPARVREVHDAAMESLGY